MNINLSDIHKEHNCVLKDSTRDHLTKIFWNAYKAEDFNITSEIFVASIMKEKRSFCSAK